MLRGLSTGQTDCAQVGIAPMPMPDNRYSRNEEVDMQEAIGYLYDFKKKLDELHPNCLTLIENMLQKPNYGRY
jgi:hypothetical protein